MSSSLNLVEGSCHGQLAVSQLASLLQGLNDPVTQSSRVQGSQGHHLLNLCTCRVSGSATASTAAAGQELQLQVSFRDAFLNAVQDAADVQAQNASLAYSGPASGSVALKASDAGGSRCACWLLCSLHGVSMHALSLHSVF